MVFKIFSYTLKSLKEDACEYLNLKTDLGDIPTVQVLISSLTKTDIGNHVSFHYKHVLKTAEQ